MHFNHRDKPYKKVARHTILSAIEAATAAAAAVAAAVFGGGGCIPLLHAPPLHSHTQQRLLRRANHSAARHAASHLLHHKGANAPQSKPCVESVNVCVRIKG